MENIAELPQPSITQEKEAVSPDKLIDSFYSEFSKAEKDRLLKETEWLESLRQWNGIYDPETIAKFSANEHRIYPKYTMGKGESLIAKLHQHAFPAKERNWGINPTPKPKISADKLQMIANSLVRKDEKGAIVSPTPEEMQLGIKKFTKQTADNMTIVIADQLMEGKHEDNLKKVIESGVKYGTGVMKGALTNSSVDNEMVLNPQTGQWEQKQIEVLFPYGEFIRLWGFFPDMSVEEISECSYIYNLHRMPKHELRKLARRTDFYGDVILDVLKEKPKGNYTVRTWETEIKADKGSVSINIGNDVVKTNSNIDINAYEVLERDGYIDGYDLWQAGLIDEDKSDLEFFVNTWLLDKKIIKFRVYPSYIKSLTDIYHIFYYRKDETSIFGIGLSKTVRDTQLSICACERNMLRNAAWVSGPIGEINVSLLHPDHLKEAANIYPGKIYVRTGVGGEANAAVLRTYNIDSRIGDFIQLKAMFEIQGDLESSLPSYLFGNPSPVSDETAKGVTVRFSSLIDFIKKLIKNFDEANTGFIRSIYNWNIAYNPDESIKGDMQVEALGTTNVLIKEAIIEHISFFLQSMPPQAAQYFKWGEFIKEWAKLMLPNPENFLNTEEEVRQMNIPLQKKQAEIEELNKQLSMIKGEYDQAKAANMFAKAKKTMAEMEHSVKGKIIDNANKQIDGASKGLDTLLKVAEGQNAE